MLHPLILCLYFGLKSSLTIYVLNYVHIECIALFCETMFVRVELRLTVTVRVVGIEGNPTFMLDWDARMWLLLEGGKGYPATLVILYRFSEIYYVNVVIVILCFKFIFHTL